MVREKDETDASLVCHKGLSQVKEGEIKSKRSKLRVAGEAVHWEWPSRAVCVLHCKRPCVVGMMHAGKVKASLLDVQAHDLPFHGNQPFGSLHCICCKGFDADLLLGSCSCQKNKKSLLAVVEEGKVDALNQSVHSLTEGWWQRNGLEHQFEVGSFVPRRCNGVFAFYVVLPFFAFEVPGDPFDPAVLKRVGKSYTNRVINDKFRDFDVIGVWVHLLQKSKDCSSQIFCLNGGVAVFRFFP